MRIGLASGSRSGAGDSGTFRPQLTSLIDVMTILLVFLIKSFSVEGNIVTPSPDLTLPLSSSRMPARPAYTVEITRDAVIAEGRVVADNDVLARSDSLMIPRLHEWMRGTRPEGDTTAREVMIQSDHRVRFDVVKRVMYTCSKAGFSDFVVLVVEEE